MQGGYKSSFICLLLSDFSVRAPGWGKAGISKLLLPSMEPEHPPGTLPLLSEGGTGNEGVSCAVAVLPGWLASG